MMILCTGQPVVKASEDVVNAIVLNIPSGDTLVQISLDLHFALNLDGRLKRAVQKAVGREPAGK